MFSLGTCVLPVAVAADEQKDARSHTRLGIDGTRFTLNGQPAFLLGISYYGGLGAPEEFIRRDLDDLQRLGFNWLRVWATWGAFDHDVSAVDATGRSREPFLAKLQWLLSECDRRGLVADVTLTRGKAEPPAGACTTGSSVARPKIFRGVPSISGKSDSSTSLMRKSKRRRRRSIASVVRAN